MKSKQRESAGLTSGVTEYLTFIAANGDDEKSIEMRYESENIWLTQKMMAELYGVSIPAINQHIKKIFDDGELLQTAVIKKYLITATDGKVYNTNHYNLQLIIAVGFKVNNERAVRFRKWAGQIVKDYTIQGWVMDVERQKQGHMFTDEYFERQLDYIREIRLSERKFYQKITDIYATSFDYDKDAKTTREFFAKVQNKLHYAVHGNTASEVIYNRADATKENMGLMVWHAAPAGKIQKKDVTVAKNYLSNDELKSLELIVSAYLDLAERRTLAKTPMGMEDWAKHLDLILQADGSELLTHAGSISAEIAKEHALSQFERYRIVQDQLYKSDYDVFWETVEGRGVRGDE